MDGDDPTTAEYEVAIEEAHRAHADIMTGLRHQHGDGKVNVLVENDVCAEEARRVALDMADMGNSYTRDDYYQAARDMVSITAARLLI